MGELMEAIGQADLVEDFQNGRVEGVPTELAVEVLVCLEQRHGDPLACQEQSQHHPARSASDHAAAGFLHIADIVHGSLARSRSRLRWHRMDLLYLAPSKRLRWQDPSDRAPRQESPDTSCRGGAYHQGKPATR